jgi:hypothetical protein
MENAIAALALLACPLGMGLMMWLMGMGMRSKRASSGPAADEPRADQRRLSAEIKAADREGHR